MTSRKLLVVLCAALLASCATVQNPVTGRQERTVMDEQSELRAGQEADKQVREEYGVYNNLQLQNYVNEVGQKLAKLSHRSNLQWHFTVVDSPEINAFALPGGYVYITRGIMAYLDSEAELAGVIGHEIGHVTARHASQRATRQQTAGLGVLAASVLGAVLESRTGVGGLGEMASQASQVAAAGYITSYGREQELQSDQLGAEYLSRSGYDPKTMIKVIGVLKSQEQFAADQARAEGREVQQRSTWLSSHPSNDQRLADITRIAQQYQSSYGDSGRDRYLRMMNGVTFGDSKEQGLVRGRNFYHEPMGIVLTAPPGWKLQNSADALLMVNPEGTAAVAMKLVPPNIGNNHEEIIRKAYNPKSGRWVDRNPINNFASSYFAGQAQTQQGQTANVEARVITGPANRSYLFQYMSKDAPSLDRARPQLGEAVASFRAFSELDRGAAREWRIKTVPYQRGALPQLARSVPLTSFQEQQLRLMNGVYSGGEPQPGQLIKTVE